jgi:signal transduction histidine kinase/ligand-binding sensor domain-containing protein
MSRCRSITIRRLVSVALLFPLLTIACKAVALEPTTRLTQYAHKSWQLGDAGLLGAPQGIAQTRDGYIWASTSNGLFRFDGVRFQKWTPPAGESLPSSSLWHLFGARNGSLYVGTDRGLARITGGHVYNYPDSPRWAGPFVEDAHGTVWMGVGGAHSKPSALCKVDENRLDCFGSVDGFKCIQGLSNTVTPDGYIWVGSSEGTCRWKEGMKPEHEEIPALERQNGLRAVTSLASSSKGLLWAGTEHAGVGEGLLHFADGSWITYVTPAVDGKELAVSSLLSGRDDALWIGTIDKGLYRLSRGILDHLDVANGLSGRRILAMLEDREGGLWVVTPMGIDYFRDYATLSFTSNEGALDDRARSVAAQGNDVYLGSNTLLRLRNGVLDQVRDRKNEALRDIHFLFSDSSSNLWIGAGNRLLVLQAGGAISQIDSFGGSGSEIVVYITEDEAHDIWVSSQDLRTKRSSLLRIHDEKVIDKFAGAPGIGDQVMNALAPNPAGGLWVGGALHGLFWFHNSRFERVLTQSFDDRIENLLQEPDGSLWLVTPKGFIRYAGGRFKLLDTAAGLPCSGAVNIQDDNHGSKWLYMHCGILRVSDSDLSAWWTSPHGRITGKFLGPLEGARPNLFDGSPAQTSDGALWSANGYVFQTIMRNHLPFNPIPPPVNIEMLSADGKELSLDHRLRVGPNTREVQIDYSGLSFLIPEQVRFRYFLHGHDTQWVNAGTRRQAFYNDLPPGHYVFQVTACNNDGVWNEQGANISFDVLPSWNQTMLFRLLAVFLGTALAAAAYFLRLRRYASSLKIRFDERLEERTRLARDLHDTLLQTIQGSKLVADNARDHADNPQTTVRALDRLSEWLERAISEGREALEALRSSAADSHSLTAALRRALDDCVFNLDLKTTVSVHGMDRELHPIARDEIYRIAFEAIRNACAHSGGTRIDIDLFYRRRSVQLEVHDNGRGVDPTVQQAGRTGHFGLTGMRERALSLGGTLNILSTPNIGTTVSLRLPGNAAYLRLPWRPHLRMLKSFRSRSKKNFSDN